MRSNQTPLRYRRFAVCRAHAFPEFVQHDLGTHPRDFTETLRRRLARTCKGNARKVQPDRIAPTGSVQAGQRRNGQPCLVFTASGKLVTLQRRCLIGRQKCVFHGDFGDFALEALQCRDLDMVGHRAVERAFTAVADAAYSIAHGIVAGRQLDHERSWEAVRVRGISG